MELTKRLVGDSPNTWKEVLRSDETKMEPFGHQGQRYVWRRTSHHAENTTPTVKHGVVAASCCGDVFHRQGLGNWSELKERWMALNTERFLRQMGGWILSQLTLGYSVSSAVFNLVLPLHFLSFFFLFLESRIVINAWLSFSFFNLPAVNLKRENLRKSANCSMCSFDHKTLPLPSESFTNWTESNSHLMQPMHFKQFHANLCN